MSEQTTDWKVEAARVAEVVVGCQLMAGKTLPDLAVADFIDVRHSRIWAAMLELEGEGFVPDLSLVSERLGTKGELDLVGGYSYLAHLAQLVIGVQQVEYFTRQVKEAAWKAAAADLASKLLVDIQGGMDAGRALGKARAAMEAVEARMGAQSQADKTLGEVYEIMATSEPGARKICDVPDTAIPGWDKQMGPLRSGQVVLIGGPAEHNKSWLAQTLTMSAAKAGQYFLNISLEMPQEELAARYMLLQAGVDIDTAADAKTVLKQLASSDVGQRIIISEANDALTPQAIYNKIESEYMRLAKEGKTLAGVSIDHGNLVHMGVTDNGQLANALGSFSARLKGIAKKYDMVVILLMQLTYPRLEYNNRPRLDTAIRASKAPYHDADLAVMVWNCANVEGAPHKAIEIHLDKMRGKRLGPNAPLVVWPAYAEGGYKAANTGGSWSS